MKKSQWKRRKKSLILTLTLALTLFLLTILTPNPIAPHTATTLPTKNTATITGQGADTNATLIITGNTTSPGQADTESGFNIPCPQNWGILNTTLTITNITAPSATIKTGERPGNTSSQEISVNTLLAMSFRIPTDTVNLNQVSIYINPSSSITLSVAKTITLYVANASFNESSGFPEPGSAVLAQANLPVPGSEGWLNFSFSSVILNSSNTYDKTFFVLVEGSVDKVAYWAYVEDDSNNNDGYAYIKPPSKPWNYMPVDFKMRVVVEPGLVYPSEVDLKVGLDGVAFFTVEDVPGQRGNGKCVITAQLPPPQDGYVHFNASTNYTGTVYFNVTQADSTLYRQVSATTVYSAMTGQSVYWNVTVKATGDQGFPEAGAGKFINVSIPADWWNLTGEALNVSNGNTISNSPYLCNDSGMLLFEATNGTWVIQCGGPNVLSELKVYALYRDWSPVEVGGAVVGDNLTINGTLSSALTGTANLTVLNESGGVVLANQTGFSGGSVAFKWSVADPGNYVLRLLVYCGLEVGLLEKNFSVSAQASCSISLVHVESVGVVKIKIYVSRSDTGFPVVGASVNVAYANGSRIEAAVTDYENGTYLVVFKPPSEGQYNFTITVSGSHIATTQKTVNVYYSYEYTPSTTPDYSLGLALVTLQLLQVVQSSRMFSVLGAASIAATAGGISGSRAYRRLRAPTRALSSIENILVSHKETGLPIWGFDVLSLEVDEALVSGFISAVRSFAEEMKIGGFNTLETRLGTFIKVEGELIEALCITGATGRLEVEWIRSRLRELVKLVEAEAGPALGKWKGGDTEEFKEILDHAFNTLFDPQKITRIQQTKILKLMKEKEHLIRTLNAIEETPELNHEKELLQQRLAIINSTLTRTKIRELTIISDTKTREELQKTRKELDTLKKELDELKQTKPTKKKTTTTKKQQHKK
ncbi:MAG: hypothetical protein QW225_11640 [Candidatus Jordarchaeales archaeon]